MQGKKALVTGAGRGLGRAIALTLASRGADVACWDINGEGLTETARLIQEQGRKAVVRVMDITRTSEIPSAVNESAIIIDAVDSVTTGVKNANIEVWGHKADEKAACEICKVDAKDIPATENKDNKAVTNADGDFYSNGVYTLRQILYMGVDRTDAQFVDTMFEHYKDVAQNVTAGAEINNNVAYITVGGTRYIVDQNTQFVDVNEGVRRLVGLITAWKHEIEEIMGGMGINAIEALRGNRLMLRGLGLNSRELDILGIMHAGE